MDSNNLKKDTSLGSILGDFISSYATRDTNMSFPDWLADRLRQELPGLEPDASARLAGDIIEVIDGYDKTLGDLNRAIETGQSKEEWLSERLAEAYAEMSPDAAGETLQRMEKELLSENAQLMGETDRSQMQEEAAEEYPTSAGWNKYSLKAKAHDIGRQLNSVALIATAGAMERSATGEEATIGDIVTDAFQTGLHSSPDEVKAVVAGAVRAYAEMGLSDTLPADTPTEVIGNLAGAAVESAEAFCDAANGSITMTEAVDKAGRAGIAAGCRIGAGFLRGKLTNVPVVGPVLVDLLGGLLEHLESPQFFNNVYTTVRGAAIATWEGIKKSKVVQGIKQIGQKIFS